MKQKKPLDERVLRAAEEALAADGTVSMIGVLQRLGWVDYGMVKRWRQGRVACLEELVQSSRSNEVIALVRSFATARQLIPREAQYLAATSRREALRFSRSGEPATESLYRTHWASPALPEKKRARLAEKADRAPELVVIAPLNDEWKCHRCGRNGELLLMEPPGPACLSCAGLADLEFLPAGDALLTRRARARSTRRAVVVRFSRTRGRYERRGLLLDPQAIAEVRRESGQ